MEKLKFIGDRLYGMRRKLATWGLFVVAAYVAIHVIFGANGWMVYEKKKADYRQISSEVERLKQDNKALADYNQALQHDPKTIETEARNTFRYAKPHEVIVVIPPPLPKENVTSTAQNRDTKK